MTSDRESRAAHAPFHRNPHSRRATGALEGNPARTRMPGMAHASDIEIQGHCRCSDTSVGIRTVGGTGPSMRRSRSPLPRCPPDGRPPIAPNDGRRSASVKADFGARHRQIEADADGEVSPKVRIGLVIRMDVVDRFERAPVEALRVSLSGILNRSRFVRFEDPVGSADFSGNHMPYAPRAAAQIALDGKFEAGRLGAVFPRAAVRYVASHYFDPAISSASPPTA